jgi:nucleoredoxin
MLVDLYKEAKALGDNEFEVVFCSSDHDNSSFNGYFSDMPWTAVPFANDRVRASLSSAYHVQGIPSLIVLDRSGHVIDGDGRSTVSSLQDAGACMRRWSK